MTPTRAVFLILALSRSLLTAPVALPQSQSNVRIVAQVELVQIQVTVFDEKGSVATNLNKGDFLLKEDGVEQNIIYCERERETASFVILADLSSSMTKKIPFVKEAALSMLDPVAPPVKYPDEFSIFGVATRVTQLVPFTRDQQDLEHRLPLLLTPTNGSTALFDGIYWGVNTASHEAENSRRAVIIISDGGDNHSRYSLKETKRLLQEADVPVFAVMAGPSFELPEIFTRPQNKPNTLPGSQQRKTPLNNIPFQIHQKEDYIGLAERHGPHNLKHLTEATGGGVFTAKNVEDLPRIVRTIGLAVRYRYVLTYRPTAVPNAGVAENGDAKFHKIHIELRPKEKFAGYGIPYYKRGYSRIE
jgi:Ca-activated chloride channel family protein